MPTLRRTVDAKGFSLYQSAAAALVLRRFDNKTKKEVLRERAVRICNSS